MYPQTRFVFSFIYCIALHAQYALGIQPMSLSLSLYMWSSHYPSCLWSSCCEWKWVVFFESQFLWGWVRYKLTY